MTENSTTEPPCGYNPSTCYVDCARRHICRREARQIEARGDEARGAPFGGLTETESCKSSTPHDEPDDHMLAILEHALGLPIQEKPYRKHYVAPMWSSWYNECEALVRMGFMVRFGDPDSVGQTYHVTPAGAARVGVLLP